MFYALPFPQIDPVLLQLGPVKIHWYGVAYVLGIIIGWQWAVSLAKRFHTGFEKIDIDDAIMWILGGIVIGGRLGHILFYDLFRYLQAPWEIIMVWKGGMSFHGGLLGVMIALAIYCRKRQFLFFALADIFAVVTPIGLCLGRIANFINGELYGRVTTVEWGIIFPHGGPFPRHPSQLYEAALEGITLLAILWFCATRTKLPQTPGRLSGIFLLGYGLSRSFAEIFREPETFGLMMGNMTWGQILCTPLIGLGWFLLRRPASSARPIIS